MQDSKNKIITQAFAEYSGYVASGRKGKYVPSKEVSENISKLSRELEMKRQLGSLTQSETATLKQIDEFTEKTMNFNQDSSRPQEESKGVSVYDLEQQLKMEEHEEERPVAIPRISNQMAEDIIQRIDEQFEKKVMNEVREDRSKSHDTSDVPERTLPEELVEGSTGTNLRDYLTAIKGNQHEVPFADRDSHLDLSKLVKRQG